ncbi:MAG TPA: tail fiber protein [Longimicrobiales bacterium]|nr:tail fiber protein [Longimicrobiales bacterium]
MAKALLGEIRMFGGQFAPDGWALCDGRRLAVDQHRDLFALIGTRYGGDGVNDFAVPDLCGRVPVHRPVSARSGPSDGVQPSLTVTFLISLTGPIAHPDWRSDSWGSEDADRYIGEIRIFATTRIPRGWVPCDGRMMRLAENTSLFSLLGTLYGGDGRETYALPDLRGRVPVMWESRGWSGPGAVGAGGVSAGTRAAVPLIVCISLGGDYPPRS